MKKLLFIVNPHSGKGHIKTKMLDVIDIFIKGGYEPVVHVTQTPDDAYHMTKEKGREFDTVAVSGGDGSLNEIIQGIMTLPDSKRPKIGYLPAGTTNDFASSMNIPRDIVKAAKKVVNGTPFGCDVGEFNKSNFVYIAAFGAFTNVSYETPQQNKNILGQMAYFLEGIKQIHALPSVKMSVTFDGETINDEFIFGMVSNSNSVAGIKTTKAYKTQFNDGLFEVILIKKPTTLVDMSNLATQLLNQELESDAVRIFKTNRIQFSSDEEVRWTLDGEFGGAVKDAIIEVKKEAVKLII